MTRTQVQLPDALYAAARDLADRMEISLAELVRRGLEYMLAVAPAGPQAIAWQPPEPVHLGACDPFSDDDWRLRLHTERLRVAESGPGYEAGGAPS